MTQSLKCIIILSSKSCGSTALQSLLTSTSFASHIEKTRHREFETLYWTKAASILRLPQEDMYMSEVPLSPEKARPDLIRFLQDNLESFTPPPDEQALIFGGWKLLCEKYAPVFVEKSPHHLHQWSALQLIAECMERYPEIEFLLIGLVRNPMDTLYSKWRRWRSIPERYQSEWRSAYENLLKFKDKLGDRLLIVRYEDIVQDLSSLKPVFGFMGTQGDEISKDHLHSRSVHKWKKDSSFGFCLSKDVIETAEKFGYGFSEMENKGRFFWPASKYLFRAFYLLRRYLKHTLKKSLYKKK
jgi:hypothetical protein